jgi:hypothetical protein
MPIHHIILLFLVILELHLYAMYGRNKKILALLVFLTAAEDCDGGVVWAFQAWPHG